MNREVVFSCGVGVGLSKTRGLRDFLSCLGNAGVHWRVLKGSAKIWLMAHIEHWVIVAP